MDISGPFPVSTEGYKYILSAQCLFSKWVQSFPLRRQTANEVADCLFKNLFLQLGFPSVILSDQGKQFDGELFKLLCEFADIHKMRTSPYKSSTNGLIERWNRTLNSLLARVVSDDHKSWPQHIGSAVLAYNSTVHKSTGFTPFRLMLGR